MVQHFSWKRFNMDQPPSEAEPLHWACWNRQPAAVRAALAAGADPNGRSATGSPPLLTLTLGSKVMTGQSLLNRLQRCTTRL